MEGGDSAGNGPDNENAPSVFQTSHSSLALPEPVGPRHPSLPSRTIYLQTAPVGRSRTSRTIWSWAANGRPILTRTVEAQRSPCSSNSCGNLERYHRYSPRVRQVGRCHDSRKSKEGGGELTLPSPSSSSKTLLARVPPCLAARSPPRRWDQAAGLAAGRPSRTGPPPSSRRRGDAEAEAVGKRV